MRDDRTPAHGGEDAGARGCWTDSAIVTGLVLALTWSLRQRAFHGLDAQHFIGMVRDHGQDNYSHPLYLPLVKIWHALLAPTGATPFEALRSASGVGVAVGALTLHRAGLAMGLTRAAALMATALACSAPAVVFFATVVEIHGVFFAFAGLAYWAWTGAVRAGRRPDGARWPHFAWLGVATALASGVHSSGHALLWLLPAMMVGGAGAARLPWRLLTLTLLVHVLATLAIRSIVGAHTTGVTGLRETLAAALAYWGPRVPWHPLEVLGLLWREWLQPFLPLSLATLAALAVRPQRRQAAAILVGVAPLLGLVWLLLHRELYERGAYLLPFAWPAALLVVGWWRPWLQVAAVALSLGLAIGQVVRHDQVTEEPALTRVLGKAIGPQRAFVLCLDLREVEQTLRDLPTATPRPLDWLTGAVARGYEPLCAEFDAWVAPYLDAGAPVWMTPGARAFLDLMNLPPVRRFVAEHLAQRYVLHKLDDPAFPAVRVERR